MRLVDYLRDHVWWWTPLVVGVAMALLSIVVVDGIQERRDLIKLSNDAVESELELRRVSTERIDALVAEIAKLRGELALARSEVGALRRRVEVLRDQVVRLGGTLVVIEDTPRLEPEDPPGKGKGRGRR